jgi:hypothetical protein
MWENRPSGSEGRDEVQTLVPTPIVGEGKRSPLLERGVHAASGSETSIGRPDTRSGIDRSIYVEAA